MQSQPSERAAVIGKISPANYNNTVPNTDYVDMSKFHEVMFVLLLGSTGNIDSTVDFLVRESIDTSDTGGQTLTGKTIAQFSGTDDAKVAVVNVKSSELSAGYRYLRGRATVGNGTTNIIAVVALGMKPRFAPGTDDDLAAVAQVIT
jgi:hypothetical protein